MRLAAPEVIEEAIRPGGLAAIKTGRIQLILDTLHRERGECSLEHMRAMSDEQVDSRPRPSHPRRMRSNGLSARPPPPPPLTHPSHPPSHPSPSSPAFALAGQAGAARLQGRGRQDGLVRAHVLPGAARLPRGHARLEDRHRARLGAQGVLYLVWLYFALA